MKRLSIGLLAPLALWGAFLLLLAPLAPAVAGAAGAAAPPWSEGTPGLPADPDLARLNRSLSLLAERLRPAVVQIGVAPEAEERDLPPEHPPLPPGERPRVGSGFIIHRSGYIVTNNHVVEDAAEVEVHLTAERKLPAKVVGRDARTDLALLKIEAPEDLPAIPLGDSDALAVGELVLAIGNPFGLDHAVSLGIVSRKGRGLGASGPFDDYIQTDASINPGNSGGPLVNIRGEAVGIATAVIPNRRVGFAIPINLAKALLPELQERGRIAWGFLGVGIQGVTPDLAKELGLPLLKGALVNNVLAGYPAQEAGIKRGDVIVSFDGKPIEDVRALQRAVGRSPVGKPVEVRVYRGGQLQSVAVTVGEMRGDRRGGGVAPSRRELGLVVEELDAEKAKRFKLPEEEGGLVVTEVAKGGAAAQAGIRAGDLVKEVNRREIKSLETYRRALKREAAGEADLFLLKRGESFFYVAVRPKG